MDKIKTVSDVLLSPGGMGANDLSIFLDMALQKRVDFADLFFECNASESWSLEDGIVKSGHVDFSKGVGVRTFSGEARGFAYADDIHADALKTTVDKACITSLIQSKQPIPAWQPKKQHQLYDIGNPLEAFSEQDKVALLQQIDRYVRQQDPRVKQVMTSLSGSHTMVLVAATDGTLAADIRPLVRMNIQVIAEHQGRIEQGYAGFGGRFAYDDLFDASKWQHHAQEAVRTASVNLEAASAPAGVMPVVLGAGWPGVLLHEAVGHGLEGDFNRKGTSSYADKMGEEVASPLCTIVDQGDMPQRRGSLCIDDEGTVTQTTTLIEQGKLVGYMQDKHNAHLMGVSSTGNGRRESYAHLPMPRMTNTYMLPGEHTQDEMIASIDKGLYAVNFNGGQVDITSGKFVFVTSEAYLIEGGKITQPVKGATLIGDGPSTMQQVSMVGDDLALDAGIGICGKDGQSVPVGVGQPTLKLDAVTVGGTQ